MGTESSIFVAKMSRRNFLLTSAALAGGVAAADLIAACGSTSTPAAKGMTSITMQLDWLIDSTSAGEVVAYDKGFYRDEGIDMTLRPGGAAIQPTTVVASGTAPVGVEGSIPYLFLGRANGIPVKCFAAGLQKHPYCFLVLKSSGITGPQDFVGKTIGIPAGSEPLVQAIIAKYQLPADQIKIVHVAYDLTPLVQHKVDAFADWATSYGDIQFAGGLDKVSVLLLWDMGIRLYGYPYFATDDVIKNQPDVLAGLLNASGKGWAWVADNQSAAVDIVMKYAGSAAKRDDMVGILNSDLAIQWSDLTKSSGWGYMDPTVWQDAIDVYKAGGVLKKPVAVSDVMTLDILNHASGRPKR